MSKHNPTIKPTTATEKPTISTPEPTPATVSPTGLTPEPTPVTASPTGLTPEPTPVTASPTGLTPEPTPVTASPTGLTPEPTPVTVSPTGSTPEPTPATVSPTGSTPEPTPVTASPTGSTPEPIGQTPTSQSPTIEYPISQSPTQQQLPPNNKPATNQGLTTAQSAGINIGVATFVSAVESALPAFSGYSTETLLAYMDANYPGSSLMTGALTTTIASSGLIANNTLNKNNGGSKQAVDAMTIVPLVLGLVMLARHTPGLKHLFPKQKRDNLSEATTNQLPRHRIKNSGEVSQDPLLEIINHEIEETNQLEGELEQLITVNTGLERLLSNFQEEVEIEDNSSLFDSTTTHRLGEEKSTRPSRSIARPSSSSSILSTKDYCTIS